MPLKDPLNDKKCLRLLKKEAQRLSKLPSVREFASNFESIQDLVHYIRQLDQRDDLGHVWDGPRLPCAVSQRTRFAPSDPNCWERVLLFWTVAMMLEPELELTGASMMLNGGWHTFPVVVRNGVEEVIVLDPYAPPRNAMAVTASQARNSIPTTSANLSPWFLTLTRNACLDEGTEDCHERAIHALRNGLITGEPLDYADEVDYILDLAAEDAELWGMPGRRACNRVESSVRNLSHALHRNQVRGFLDSLFDKGKEVAPDAIKAALIAKFGPAAAIALQGVDLAMAQQGKKPDASAQTPTITPLFAPATQGIPIIKTPAETASQDKQDKDKQDKDKQDKVTNAKLKAIQRLRRMAWKFGPNTKQ